MWHLVLAVCVGHLGLHAQTCFIQPNPYSYPTIEACYTQAEGIESKKDEPKNVKWSMWPHRWYCYKGHTQA